MHNTLLNALPLILSGFFTGLAGSTHCLAMCGGITTSLAIHSQNKKTILSYQFGRLFSYTLLGLLAGILLPLLNIHPQFGESGRWLRRLSSLLIALIALNTLFQLQLWRKLEHYGMRFWRPIAKLIQKLLPIRSLSDAFLIGSLWGLLPCGLIYAALAVAITTANPITSALTMLSFGIGTLLSLLTLSLFSKQFAHNLQKKSTQILLGLSLLLFSILSWP